MRLELLTEGPTPEDADALEGRWKHLMRLRDEGRIFVGRSGETEPNPSPTSRVHGTDETAAREMMESDQVVVAGPPAS